MSLLLDALKKAADDKNAKSDNPASSDVSPEQTKHEQTKPEQAKSVKQNSNHIKSSEPSTIEETADNDLDLNLELNSKTTDTQAKKEVNEEFPEVDESVISKAKKASALKQQATESTIKSSKKLTDTFDSNQTKDLEVLPLELSNDKNHVDNPDLANTNNDQVTDTKKAAVNNNQTSRTITQNNTDRIKNEQALSALINKSNKHSRSDKLKKNIALIAFIILSFIGSVLYLYIESQTTKQNIYIASHATPVTRDIPSQKKNLAPAQTPKSSTAIQKTVFSKPETLKPVAPKKQVPKPDPVISKPLAAHKASKKPISIVRTNKIDPIHVLLRDAYNAFINQNYRQSAVLYKKALQREARNRDALLGLAAIATKEKRFEFARQKYRYLLKLNPKDSIAIAGLSSLENQVNPQLTESQLNFMLKNQAESAHLYFALGTQYSSQKRWAEAQSAYFSAWSSENKNADYAYNLAVSLDHLDKKKQALEFYKLSLELNKASRGNFSQADTQQRILALQESSL